MDSPDEYMPMPFAMTGGTQGDAVFDDVAEFGVFRKGFDVVRMELDRLADALLIPGSASLAGVVVTSKNSGAPHLVLWGYAGEPVLMAPVNVAGETGAVGLSAILRGGGMQPLIALQRATLS